MNLANKNPKSKKKSSIESQYAVFDALLEGVQVIDYNWRFMYVNDTYQSQVSLPKEELLGYTLMEIFHDIDQTKVFKMLKECMELRIHKTFLTDFEFNNGKIGHYELRMQPVPEGVLVLSIDDTERINSLKLLKESNERYRFVTKATFDAIWDWNLIDDSLFWGDGFRTIFGYGMQNTMHNGNSRTKYIHKEDQKRISTSLSQAIASGKTNWSGEYKFLKRNGEFAFVIDRVVIIKNSNDKAVRLVGAIQDITIRKMDELQKTIISEINLRFTRTIDVKEILHDVLNTFIKFSDFNFAEVWLPNLGKNSIDLIAKQSTLKNSLEYYEESLNACQLKKGEGLPGHIWENREVEWWRIADKKEFFKYNQASEILGLKTMCGLPLLSQNEIVGVLILGSDKELVQSKNQLKFLEGFTFTFGNEIKRKQLEQELVQIFNAAPDIICLIGFDGYLKKINPTMCDLMGYSESELLSVPFKEFVHFEDRILIDEEFLHLHEKAKALFFENRCITKEGKIIWLSWAANPVLEDGLIYSVAKDITEKKELQNLLNKSNYLARIGSWEIDLIGNKSFYSEITKEIY